jgi:hypothetical protein
MTRCFPLGYLKKKLRNYRKGNKSNKVPGGDIKLKRVYVTDLI